MLFQLEMWVTLSTLHFFLGSKKSIENYGYQSKNNMVLVPYMDSVLNMDTPNIFKNNTFYRYMLLRVREEKQMKR